MARYKDVDVEGYKKFRIEHEDECPMFERARDSYTIDKSSTFRKYYSRYTLYNMWVATEGTKDPQHNTTLLGINWCPFCGKNLSDYNETEMEYEEYNRYIRS